VRPRYAAALAFPQALAGNLFPATVIVRRQKPLFQRLANFLISLY
jgi:hypothetical protein